MPDTVHGLFHRAEHHDNRDEQTGNTKGAKGGKVGILHIVEDCINGIVQVSAQGRGLRLGSRLVGSVVPVCCIGSIRNRYRCPGCRFCRVLLRIQLVNEPVSHCFQLVAAAQSFKDRRTHGQQRYHGQDNGKGQCRGAQGDIGVKELLHHDNQDPD